MSSSLFSGFALLLLLVSALIFACSAPGTSEFRGDASGAGMSGRAGNTQSTAGEPAGGAGSASGGSGGGALGMSGAAVGGVHSAGVAGGGAPSSGGGGGAAAGNAACPTIAFEYESELEKQLACDPSLGSQCTNRAAAAPGCECRVFIQPTDPFAIEHLSNVANAWFEADCSGPSCPAQCSTAAAGTCQADSKSPRGGRCITP
jgi:hypothetical protein